MLNGQSLNWICCDQHGLLVTHLRDLLENWAHRASVSSGVAVRPRLNQYITDWSVGSRSRDELAPMLASGNLGLIAWNVTEASQLESACAALQIVLQKSPRVRRLCYVTPELSDWCPILLEAGAQNVVSQLTSLRLELDRLLQHVQLSSHGFHPLTGGLVDRLPWRQST